MAASNLIPPMAMREPHGTGPLTKRHRKGRGPRALASLLDPVLRPALRRRGAALAPLLTDWPAVVGETLAACSLPERLTYARGEGEGATLHLRVANGSLATQLQHLEPQLLERINSRFGYRAVGRLRLLQGPLPPSPPSPEQPLRTLTPTEEEDLGRRLAGIESEELRAALAALGSAILGRR